MELIAFVLAVLGIIFIFIGWKTGKNSSSNEEELLVVLKGMANLKKEVSRIETMISSLEEKVENQETAKQAPLVFDQLIKSELATPYSNKQQTYYVSEKDNQLGKLIVREDRNNKEDRTEKLLHAIQQLIDSSREEHMDDVQNKDEEREGVSNTYLEVLRLYDEGLSIQEISRKLKISQDAVNMVILTSVKGGKQ